MVLTPSTVAPTLRLTTRAAIKAELGISASTDDALIDSLIDQVSASIVSYCHRPFARETYSETLPGFGDMTLQLSRTPVVVVTVVSMYGSVITDYVIENPDRGWLAARSFSGTGNDWNREQWPWTAQSYGGLSGGGSFLDIGTPMPRQEEPAITVGYTAGYILPSQFLVAQTTVSAASADSSFNDSASGFPALLKAGDIVETSGFVNPANNGRFLVSGTPTTAKIIVSATLTTEAAGASATVKFRPPATHRAFDDVERAAILAGKAAYLTRRDDPSVIEKQVGALRIRRGEMSAVVSDGLPAVCVGLLRPWVRAA